MYVIYMYTYYIMPPRFYRSLYLIDPFTLTLNSSYFFHLFLSLSSKLPILNKSTTTLGITLIVIRSMNSIGPMVGGRQIRIKCNAISILYIIFQNLDLNYIS